RPPRYSACRKPPWIATSLWHGHGFSGNSGPRKEPEMAAPASKPDPHREGNWKRVEHLFHEVLEQPEGERDAWLAAQAVGPAIREEVQSLLDSLRRQDRLFAATDDSPSLPDAPAGS